MPQTCGYVYEPITGTVRWLSQAEFRKSINPIHVGNAVTFLEAKWFGVWVPVVFEPRWVRPANLDHILGDVFKILNPPGTGVCGRPPEPVPVQIHATDVTKVLAEITKWLGMHDGGSVVLEIMRSGVPIRVEIDDTDGSVVYVGNPEDPE